MRRSRFIMCRIPLNFPVNSVSGTSSAVHVVEFHYEIHSLCLLLFLSIFEWNETWQFCQIHTWETLQLIIARVAVDAEHFSFKLCAFWFTQKVITVQLTLSMQSITSTYPYPVDAIHCIAHTHVIHIIFISHLWLSPPHHSHSVEPIHFFPGKAHVKHGVTHEIINF